MIANQVVGLEFKISLDNCDNYRKSILLLHLYDLVQNVCLRNGIISSNHSNCYRVDIRPLLKKYVKNCYIRYFGSNSAFVSPTFLFFLIVSSVFGVHVLYQSLTLFESLTLSTLILNIG